jgi:glycine/D-amino acid oxidase-like deaminating enzyme
VVNADVLIIGGGIIGSSIAYNLLNDGFNGKVVVFERDRSYEFASTPLAAGGIRQQFANPLNIKMVQYSLKIYENFDRLMAVDDDPAKSYFQQNGYVYLLDSNNFETFDNNYKIQKKFGAMVERLTPEQTQEVCRGILNLKSIKAANFGPNDGRVDPWSVLQGFIRKAKSFGAVYVYDEVSEILYENSHVYGLRTKSGTTFNTSVIINAAGAWAQEVGKLADIPLPVEPTNHNNYFCHITEKFRPNLPMVVFPNRVWFMGESENTILTGLTKYDQEPGFDWRWDENHFMENVWPKLAERVPLFETLKLGRGYAGLYENTPDECCILGEHPELLGFYLAVGFSGHGIMQAPAAGKLISELIRLGRYETIDISDYSIERFTSGGKSIVREKSH